MITLFLIQICSLSIGGDNLTEAFEQAGVALFGYMTDIETVSIESVQEIEVTDADDMLGLLYRFLDELLFLFCAEPFFIARVRAMLPIMHTIHIFMNRFLAIESQNHSIRS